MEHDQRKEATTVHHHFTISHDGAPRQPGSLRETQDLLLASGLLNMERSSSAQMAHEHRFHQLRDDQDREQLKERIREKEPGKTHVFLDSFRSVDAIAGGPLSHLLQDVASVRRCLRWALRIELATVPPYIYALYSLADQKCHTAQILKSIAAEEMLHAGLVANLLTALGGQPTFFFDEKSACTDYPVSLEHMGGLRLGLLPFGPAALEQFLALEQPSDLSASSAASAFAESGEFASVGQLYGAVEAAIERLAREGHDLFGKPRPELQLAAHNYKVIEHNVAESGGLHPVISMADARAALATIVHQGEGLQDSVFADAAHSELTHFSKLLQLRERELRGAGDAVQAVPANPHMSECKDSDTGLLCEAFNAAYAALLLTLQELYAEADKTGRLNARMYGLMEKVMRPVGVLLCARGFGPTFEPTVFSGPPIEHVKRLCLQAIARFPKELEKTAAGLAKLG